MRPKSIILLALALGCGLVASIGISQVLDRQKGTNAREEDTEAIYVALTDINLGDKITPEMIQLQQWPVDKIQPGAIRELEAVEGKKPSTKIFAGDPILAAKITARPDVAEQIPAGYRMFPVRVNAQSGLVGLVKPGDRVDVHWYVKENHGKGIAETEVRTLLQNIRVFAVDQQYRRSAEDEGNNVASTISLVVSHEQSQKLNLAEQLGTIRLVLRNPEDDLAVDDADVSISELFDTDTADPDKERASGGGLFGFLKEMAKNVPAGDAATFQAAPGGPFVMTILEAGDAREVEFYEGDRLPGAGPGSTSSMAAPEAFTPLVTPPSTPPQLPEAPDDDSASDSPEFDIDYGNQE